MNRGTFAPSQQFLDLLVKPGPASARPVRRSLPQRRNDRLPVGVARKLPGPPDVAEEAHAVVRVVGLALVVEGEAAAVRQRPQKRRRPPLGPRVLGVVGVDEERAARAQRHHAQDGRVVVLGLAQLAEAGRGFVFAPRRHVVCLRWRKRALKYKKCGASGKGAMGQLESRVFYRQRVRIETTLQHALGAETSSKMCSYIEIAELPSEIRDECLRLAKEVFADDVEVRSITTSLDSKCNLVERPDLWWPTFRSPLAQPTTLFVRAVVIHRP